LIDSLACRCTFTASAATRPNPCFTADWRNLHTVCLVRHWLPPQIDARDTCRITNECTAPLALRIRRLNHCCRKTPASIAQLPRMAALSPLRIIGSISAHRFCHGTTCSISPETALLRPLFRTGQIQSSWASVGGLIFLTNSLPVLF